MNKVHPPKVKGFIDKKLPLKLNVGIQCPRTLRGSGPFMNLVNSGCVEMALMGNRKHRDSGHRRQKQVLEP